MYRLTRLFFCQKNATTIHTQSTDIVTLHVLLQDVKIIRLQVDRTKQDCPETVTKLPFITATQFIHVQDSLMFDWLN